MKAFYATCAALGTILPCSQLARWLAERGPASPALLQGIVSDPLSAFAWSDVLISAVVLLAFILAESRRVGVRSLWLPVAGTLVVGVSCGLPLFLLMRERHLEATKEPEAGAGPPSSSDLRSTRGTPP